MQQVTTFYKIFVKIETRNCFRKFIIDDWQGKRTAIEQPIYPYVHQIYERVYGYKRIYMHTRVQNYLRPRAAHMTVFDVSMNVENSSNVTEAAAMSAI